VVESIVTARDPQVDPSDLLTGKIAQPAAAAPLYEALASLITEYGQEAK
jgi:lipid-binding SYLF domain-containing protein